MQVGGYYSLEKKRKIFQPETGLKALALGRRTIGLAETCECEYARESSDEGTAIAH